MCWSKEALLATQSISHRVTRNVYVTPNGANEGWAQAPGTHPPYVKLFLERRQENFHAYADMVYLY